MQLQGRAAFDPSICDESFFDSFEHRGAVFALFTDAAEPGAGSRPYLGRTRDLRRRLIRLLRSPQHNSKRLNLREITRRIEFQYAGSAFELQWLIYRLNRFHYPQQYRTRLRLKPPALVKVNLSNRFPRCYATRRISKDDSMYYGPFPSRAAAERFAADFLDLFKIRRCVEELDPNPSHPGCIYSQMHMCLAPCYGGCSDSEYHQEVSSVVEFLDSQGYSLVQNVQSERDRASEQLDFEQAARLHRKLEKVHEVTRQWPALVRNLRDFHAVVIVPGAESSTVAFFLVAPNGIHGPEMLRLGENVSSPLSLDEQFRILFQNLSNTDLHTTERTWEHLSLLARWYYSSFREGELVMLSSSAEIPHARLIRICRKMMNY